MKVKDICQVIENYAPLNLQESYDNSGLIVGDPDMEVESVLLTIDVTMAVIDEAINKRIKFIISHHPIIFHPIKRITGSTDLDKCLIKSIKNDIAIYSAHTNLDNTIRGVSGKMAERIGLKNIQPLLSSNKRKLYKLITFVPQLHSDILRQSLFDAGAGSIGNYDNCSYNLDGYGTFRANDFAHPYVGEINKLHTEDELRIEVIFHEKDKQRVIKALLAAHPYEEPAFDIIRLENDYIDEGAGVVGDVANEMDEITFLHYLKRLFNCKTIRYTELTGRTIKRVALCGGAGSFLLPEAIRSNADIFVSSDFKYHEFMNAENKILIADLGHFESEQYTKDIFYEIITKKFPTFAIQFSEINTNPINYL